MNDHIIVALLATQGLEDFLRNSLTGLVRVGVDPRIVHVARPDNAAATIDPIILSAGAVPHSFDEFGFGASTATPEHYVDYGTESFVTITWAKVRYIRWLLDSYRHVVYADLDVGWLADPLWYLEAIAKVFPLAFQTEALRRFPPVLCWGFLSVTSAAVTLELLDSMLSDYERRSAPLSDDQSTLDAMVKNNPTLLRHVHPLSEGLFVNGIGYRNLLDQPAAAPLAGRIEPFVFHANWTVGLDNKRRLMAQTRTWLIG